jgi:hypothetical protein
MTIDMTYYKKLAAKVRRQDILYAYWQRHPYLRRFFIVVITPPALILDLMWQTGERICDQLCNMHLLELWSDIINDAIYYTKKVW